MAYRILISFACVLIAAMAISAVAYADATICLDPGHGGNDPGTAGPQGKIDEDQVNLIVAQSLRDSINIGESGWFIVGMTRNADVTVPKRDRADSANVGGRYRTGYYYFISIHHNSAPTNPCYVQGTEAWHSMNDSVPPGTLVPDSLDLSREIDSLMAYKIYLRLVENWESAGDPYVARGLKLSDSLTVLIFNKRISVLTEASFICNEDEEDLFAEATHAHEKSEAGAIYRGFKSYCDNAGIAQISNRYLSGNGGPVEIDYVELTSPVDRTWAVAEQHNLFVPDYFYLGGYWYYFHHWSHLLPDGTYLGPDWIENDWTISVPAEFAFHIYRAYFSGGPYWCEV